jgi:hypothetical protein
LFPRSQAGHGSDSFSRRSPTKSRAREHSRFRDFPTAAKFAGAWVGKL